MTFRAWFAEEYGYDSDDEAIDGERAAWNAATEEAAKIADGRTVPNYPYFGFEIAKEIRANKEAP